MEEEELKNSEGWGLEGGEDEGWDRYGVIVSAERDRQDNSNEVKMSRREGEKMEVGRKEGWEEGEREECG